MSQTVERVVAGKPNRRIDSCACNTAKPLALVVDILLVRDLKMPGLSKIFLFSQGYERLVDTAHCALPPLAYMQIPQQKSVNFRNMIDRQDDNVGPLDCVSEPT